MTVLGREEVAPRTSIALALSGVTLDPMTELQDVKGFKAGVTLRLVEGKLQDIPFGILFTSNRLAYDIWIEGHLMENPSEPATYEHVFQNPV